MAEEYVPTDEEIREYVEVGGEPQPWLPYEPEKDAARAAAFDRWLADHDARVKADALEDLVRDGIPDFDVDDWVLARAAELRGGAQ